MVVFDANFLLFLLQENVPAPQDPTTGDMVTSCKERIDGLIADLRKSKEKIIIPTPALSEVLVRADGAAHDYVAKFSRSSVFRIEPFDTRAAIELSIMTAAAKTAGKSRKDSQNETQAKLKFDRQILAIALVCGASVIYTNDEGLSKKAVASRLKAVGVHELPLPQECQASFIWEQDEQPQPPEQDE